MEIKESQFAHIQGGLMALEIELTAEIHKASADTGNGDIIEKRATELGEVRRLRDRPQRFYQGMESSGLTCDIHRQTRRIEVMP